MRDEPEWTPLGWKEPPLHEEEHAPASDDPAYEADPLRVYLRQMASTSLLTREGEVEISKRIEEGKRRVLSVVLGSRLAVRELIRLGRAPEAGRVSGQRPVR